eukprot:CAMPEP_0182930410 /NCGR_PEP_ID=MMETSP0105_2-20130417/24931_1 /TAXON_ID=81532 ORGANISM="Acanthoeca-like sp., Strain 10tr" /NCGR_SAMPLE_ID=MMETSP0105_2 /ASSEMBLY_ACC=CAM_ASM_000205 /LENGTH=80 /DNA_ID=CAMNT_0025068679 /DNA_START=146 /DNA_END=385 /DNA_ORIENTATION=+
MAAVRWQRVLLQASTDDLHKWLGTHECQTHSESQITNPGRVKQETRAGQPQKTPLIAKTIPMIRSLRADCLAAAPSSSSA